MASENQPKVLLDRHAAFIVRRVALDENRTVTNATNTLLREAWAACCAAQLKKVAPNFPPTKAQ